jgi:hypothetical protein
MTTGNPAVAGRPIGDYTERAMLYTTWSAARLIVGSLLMLIGVLGTIVPIIPGVPVFVAGIAVAGSSHPVTRFVRKRWDMWRAWSRPEAPPERRSLRRVLKHGWRQRRRAGAGRPGQGAA